MRPARFVAARHRAQALRRIRTTGRTISTSSWSASFSDGWTADGRPGFFHPDLWTFGQPLYASQIIGRALGVHGVERVLSVSMRRWNAGTGPATSVVTIMPERPAAKRRPSSSRSAVRDHPGRQRSRPPGATAASCSTSGGAAMSCEHDCQTPPVFPAAIFNRPGLDRIGYRIGDYASFRAHMLAQLDQAWQLAALDPPRRRRSRHRAARMRRHRRRHPGVLSAALRQRGVPAHRAVARERRATGGADRLSAGAGPGRRGRLRARGQGRHAGHRAGRLPVQGRSRRGDAAGAFRDRRSRRPPTPG